jgi:hypothetical protein
MQRIATMDSQTIRPNDIPLGTGGPESKSGQPGMIFAKLDGSIALGTYWLDVATLDWAGMLRKRDDGSLYASI